MKSLTIFWLYANPLTWTSKGRTTYLLQFCADTGYSLENLSGAMDDRDSDERGQGNLCKQHDLMMMMMT